MGSIKNVTLGLNVSIVEPVNLYGCSIGNNVKIGPFVEIQSEVLIGNNTTISSHSFICSGVEIGDNTFVGHGVMFTNDKFDSENINNWIMRKTKVGNNVRIGSNSTILPVTIGDNVIIGAGSVVTKDIPDNQLWYGVPAKFIKNRFTTKQINFLNKSKWWELEDEKIDLLSKYLLNKNVELFIKKFKDIKKIKNI
jgi:acetyltransferase-like isoleucine patch superfamily enzyme